MPHGIQFLSTLSLRRATITHFDNDIVAPYFYPRSPCGERLAGRGHVAGCHQISIHALLAESDIPYQRQIDQKSNFYPRSPCGERQDINGRADYIKRFLSTLSLRRATERSQDKRGQIQISIHALLAESDLIALFDFPVVPVISIHALLAESDYNSALPASTPMIFLSTLSLRRATAAPPARWRYPPNFYPRSPCGERLRSAAGAVVAHNFYPRSPCGERLVCLLFCVLGNGFLSTLSLRRATGCA